MTVGQPERSMVSAGFPNFFFANPVFFASFSTNCAVFMPTLSVIRECEGV